MKRFPVLASLAAVAVGGLGVPGLGQTPVGTAFTYQGQLKRDAVPLTDVCDFEFRLFTADVGGTQIGAVQPAVGVPLSNGLFTVELDFGASAFSGDQRFLDVAVQCSGDAVPITMAPRHALTPAPYATTALKTLGVDGHSLDAVDGSPTDAVYVEASGRVRMEKGGLTVFDDVGQGISMTSDSFTLTEGTSEDPVFSYSSATDTHKFYTSGNPSLVLGPDGNVGIGMAWNQLPSASLHINGTPEVDGIMFPDGTLQTTAATGGGGDNLWTESGVDIYYNSGNVGINTAAPASRLHVVAPAEGRAVTVTSTGEGGEGIVVSTDGLGATALDATASGPEASALDAEATNTDGIAVSATARGTNGTGIHAYSFGANGVTIRANAHTDTQVAIEANARGTATLNGYPLPNTAGKFYASGEGSVGVYAHVDEGKYGVHGRSDNSTGSGVYGEATVTGQNNGVYGTTTSTIGRGVYGYATATSGNTMGVYGRVESTEGVAVRGLAYAATGTSVAVVGQTNSPDGYAGKFFGGRNYFEGNVGIGTDSPAAKLHIGGTAGVDGLMFPDGTLQITAAGGGDSLWSGSGANVYYNGGNVGVGTSSPGYPLHVEGSGNRVVYAKGTATATTSYAVRGDISSLTGAAVSGESQASSGTASGVVGGAQSPNGVGVLGYNDNDTGPAIGVRGATVSPTGFGGYFEGRGYFSGNVGIGTDTPAAKLHIGGTAGVDGIMFPDGTLQRSAASSGGDSLWSNFGSMIYYTGGNVGVGTAIPAKRFHVVGDTRLDGIVTVGDTSVPGADVSLVTSSLYGVKANTSTSLGAAIAGEATNSTGGTVAHGVMGVTVSPLGAGVIGTGKQAGVEGVTFTTGGAGVYGHHNGAGTGVFGEVGSSTGVNYGVRGESGSVSGFGGYFINTSSDGTALYAESAGARTGDATLQVHNTQPVEGMAAYITADSNWATVHARNEGTGEVLWLARDNRDGEFIVAYDELYGRRVFSVDGDGWTKVSVLEITGGADLSEQFDVNSEGMDVEPGMVVCIDAENPGKLILADQPYDYTVAGVVSGAGGVKPGMLMGQQGTVADGHHPIALTGRVWTLCDASNGAIKPGDLLTTSDVPGHAMKVTDRTRAQGAMIGKAMTSLSEGRGLVLVLVSLQ